MEQVVSILVFILVVMKLTDHVISYVLLNLSNNFNNFCLEMRNI